jgi:Flp pilus assembly protein TadG
MKAAAGALHQWRRLARDRKAAAAVEFAGLLPFMLLLYVGGVEVALGVSADRKVTLTSRTVADLASRQTNIDDPTMTNILGASSAVIAPFDSTKVSVIVSNVYVNAQGRAHICWSNALNTTARAVGSTVTLPAALATPNTALMWGEASYIYAPTLGYYMTGSMTLYDNIYMAPRMSSTVTRNSAAGSC